MTNLCKANNLNSLSGLSLRQLLMQWTGREEGLRKQ
jgi:hypothetical protein